MTPNTTTVLPDARALVAQFGRQVGHCYEFGTGLEISGKAALDLFHAINAVIATQPAPDAAVTAGEVREAAERLLQAVDERNMRGRDHVPSMRNEQVARSRMARALAAAPKVASECPTSPDGRHQVDTSMEEGPNNCFHCSAKMGTNDAR